MNNTSTFERRAIGMVLQRTLTLTAVIMMSLACGCARITEKSQATQPHSTARQPAAPNIVLIVLDDVGFADIGAFGSEIRTPNIDSLARDGLRYNRFDTKAICSPTRAALLTGRNSHSVGMADIPDVPVSAEARAANPSFAGTLVTNAETLPQALKRAGYRTVALGKWHLAPPSEDGSEGKRASWPLQRGFDSYYGFIGGHTPQWHPALVEGNTRLPTPQQPGYHVSVDLTDRAIAAFEKQESSASRQPLFLYLAYGFAHSPQQAPADYREKYQGRYDKGWDELRKERFERMKQIGIIPATTVLPGRNQGDPAWDSLTAQQRKVFARFMENYAGFIEHGDAQIGRLLSYLRTTGRYDNTLFVLLSDNGGAPEAQQHGGFRAAYLDKTPLAEMEAHLDELGGPSTDPLYPRPWAMVSNTPFTRYKLWPFAGGMRDPLIIAWPNHIKDNGAIRGQFVDVIDIAPTLLDVAGAAFRSDIDGQPQLAVAGSSIRASFASAAAPSARSVQYFELRGNRAITAGQWKAVAMHKSGTDFAKDQWLLFDTAADFSESTDVAAQHPDKLAELQALWMTEATRYSQPPLREAPSILQQRFPQYDDAFLGPPAAKPR